jgi:uncharacterized membrane protein
LPFRPNACRLRLALAATRRLFALTALAALTLAGVIAAEPARADFRLCNDTKSLVGVALGYREQGRWATEGWWQVPGETCASLIEGDLNSRYYYLYAEDADRGGQWRGDIFMCTSDREFRIEGVEECFARGHHKTGFFEVDTGNKESWMVPLTESGQTGSSQ